MVILYNYFMSNLRFEVFVATFQADLNCDSNRFSAVCSQACRYYYSAEKMFFLGFHHSILLYERP